MSDSKVVSAPASSATTAPSTSQSESTAVNPANYRLPDNSTFQHAAKLAIVHDKPIMMDYWTASLDKKALIGVRTRGDNASEKLLVKSADEYTSPIKNFYNVTTDYIIVTENSIYLVASDIPVRKIT